MSFLKRQPSKLIRSALSLQAYKIVVKQKNRRKQKNQKNSSHRERLIYPQISFFPKQSNSFLKRMSPGFIAPFFHRGSLTVEAALVIPLFLFAVISILSFTEILRVQMKLNSSLQQTAKEEIYRADEKLVYKFISDRLVFAYDDSGALFLNSANILIPKIPGMSVKTVMAFLNSELYSYFYRKLFGEVKVLKGNLINLPFARIDSSLNEKTDRLAERVIHEVSDDVEEELQSLIYQVFEMTESEIKHIKSELKRK